jgi:hypothetical protein
VEQDRHQVGRQDDVELDNLDAVSGGLFVTE